MHCTNADAMNVCSSARCSNLGTFVFTSALSVKHRRRHNMKLAITIIAITFLALTSAFAESAKSSAPGHHAKGIHGASSYAPGHVKTKKHLHMQSARAVAPGHLKH
jgi:hypothetical protein